MTPVEINQERRYAGEPGLVFAALIHAMGECAAQVVGVEEFGTMVLFSFPAANTPERERLSARVAPASGRTRIRVSQSSDGSAPHRARHPEEFDLPAGLFEAVQHRLDNGPGSRPSPEARTPSAAWSGLLH